METQHPCHGQQEIHAKITSIGFEDCKVFIHSVDAQSSANGGIIIQVIGEMSNRNDPWRKFVQTFFLAEQPNGYFVLNDIFRFLKEETVDSDEAEEPCTDPVQMDAPAPATPAPVPAPVEPPARELTPSPPPTPEPVVEPTPVPEAAPPVEEAPVTVADVPEPPVQVATPAPETNGVHPSPSPVPVAAPEPTPAPAPAPPPVVQQAPQPKTWANLAATNSKKWGANVAQESKGHTEVVPASSTPGSGTQTPAQQPAPAPPQVNQRGPHPAYVAAQSVTTAHCFVKGVTEPISNTTLTNQLTQFGQVKEVDIVRSKACAFVEFTTVDAARRAIIACLPSAQGGGGGMWVQVGGDVGQVRITVETKKERGERPPSRPRGGAPQGDVRGGSLRGRGGPRGGRGAKP
ncbi:hypothetical protein CPB85DRAFT_1439543 [Mucidula mucida]|nr:hypothetical protein CPB85DRAFT_1439543 [Mucidula mucida]